MKFTKYSICYVAVLLCVFACQKNEKPAQAPPAPFQKAYLLKSIDLTNQDSTVCMYAQDTILSEIALLQVDAGLLQPIYYFPQYTNGIYTSIGGNYDSTAVGYTAYGFTLDASNRVLESVYLPSGIGDTFDSLAYDNQGRISADYNFMGRPGHENLQTVTNLTWDTTGDVVRITSLNKFTGIEMIYAYSYDTKVNPYMSIGAGFTMAILNPVAWQFMSAHNVTYGLITDSSTLSQQSSVETETIKYTYNPSGYPLTATQVLTQNGSSTTNQYSNIYK